MQEAAHIQLRPRHEDEQDDARNKEGFNKCIVCK